jgi:hypothetical protein
VEAPLQLPVQGVDASLEGEHLSGELVDKAATDSAGGVALWLSAAARAFLARAS